MYAKNQFDVHSTTYYVNNNAFSITEITISDIIRTYKQNIRGEDDTYASVSAMRCLQIQPLDWIPVYWQKQITVIFDYHTWLIQ